MIADNPTEATTSLEAENQQLRAQLADLQSQVEMLQAREAHTRAVVEAIPLPVLITRQTDGYIQYANTHMSNLLGLPLNDLIGHHSVDFYRNPDDRHALLEIFRKQGYLHDHELQINRADESPIWISLSMHTMQFEGTSSLFTAMYDITQRKEAESVLAKYNQTLESQVEERTTALQQKSSELEANLRALPDLFLRFDSDGTYLDIKASPNDLYLPAEELLGQQVQHVMPTELGQQFLGAINEVISQKTLSQIEYTLSIDNKLRHFEARISPLMDKEVIAVVRDITDSKHLTDELTQHRADLESLVEDRTYKLELILTLSGYLNSMLDINRLLDTMVNQVKDHFGYYHVHVYIVNEQTHHLEMLAGAGEVGRKLKAKEHTLNMGQGIVGTVASQNQPFVSNNVNTVKNFFRNPLLPATQAELAVPLRKGGRVLGVLDIQSEQIDTFSAEDIAMMQAIADQTAIALDNARLLNAQQEIIAELQQANALTEEYTRTLETITDISRNLTAILDLSDLLQFVVNRLNRELSLYHTHIYLVEEGSGRLIMAEGVGQVGRQLKKMGHHLQMGQGIVGTVATTKQHFVSNNVDEVTNFVRNPLLPNTNAELAVPMRKGDKVLGVLDVQSEQKNRFDARTITMIQSIGDQIAIAVDNARLLASQKATILKLQEMDRLKSQFLTMMSHELRTPMNAVLGFAELLMLGMSGDLPEQAQSDVQLIYDNGKHLLTLLNDILDIAKIESGLMEFFKQPVIVDDVIEHVVSASRVMLRDKTLDILVDHDETLPPVNADPTRLKQILINLVSNAIKFTEQGSVTIKTCLDPDDLNLLRFSVIDTGIGIPQEKQDEIFQAFHQADMTDTRQYGGTGLGLTICQELVSMQGGRMGLKSEAGVGSEFYFTIPLYDSRLLDEAMNDATK